MKRIILILCISTCAVADARLYSQTLLLNEDFSDGNLTSHPPWMKFPVVELITIDSTIVRSPPYSCRIATSAQLSAIETSTRLVDTTQAFQIIEHVYVQSMGDETIPILLRGRNVVLALFLLPNGLVQLDVLKSTSQWTTEQLRVPGGYTLNRWYSFRVVYNGNGVTSLYIDDRLCGSVTQRLVDVPLTLQIGNRYLPHTSTFYIDDIRVVTAGTMAPPAKVYLVLCSDTGTWDGLDVSERNVFLRFDLYSSPTGNAAQVINQAFRSRIRGSNGSPMRFTWFMLDGSMVATNTNPVVQNRWISNLEMIQLYHRENIRAVGDELSFHYHNWIWSDPDGNGVFHWNQSTNLDEYRHDFLETLGHIAIEGGLLPTSFRSGWHYMENRWEALIDSIIPYRFENTSPDQGRDTTEPLDNIYDWSRASLDWVPYHPAASDYQVRGNLKGWETRCVYMKSATLDKMSAVFAAAFRGDNQLVTIWSHLPEADFPQQIIAVDSIIHLAHAYYPEVAFDYLTATEAMKRWRGVQDDSAPTITCTLQREPDSTTVVMSLSEPLWQDAPLVFGKNPAGAVTVLLPRRSGERRWNVVFDEGSTPFRTLGIAGTDTAGNSGVSIVNIVPTNVAGREPQVKELAIYPLYPNPFNAASVVSYELPNAGSAELDVVDLLGRQVARLASGFQQEGRHSLSWEQRDVSSGVYLIRLQFGGRSIITKALVMK